jgi:hypothetical protein
MSRFHDANDLEQVVRVASFMRPLRSMAIIKAPRYGLNDDGIVGLSFAAYIAEGIGAPLFLPVTHATAVIELYGVADVSRLDGKPCWVKIHNGVISFETPCMI